MKQTLPLLILVAVLRAFAAEPTASDHPISQAAPARSSATEALDAMESEPKPIPGDRQYFPFIRAQTEKALALVETGALSTRDDFFRAGRLVSAHERRFNVARVRYELLLTAAALGSEGARPLLAGSWDQLLDSIGRPRRTDFNGLVQHAPEQYELDAAPAGIVAVLGDPAKAREGAAAAPPNPEMQAIVDADQADRRNWSKLAQAELQAVGRRDREREKRTREIIAAGELRTTADFRNASLVMQHSSGFKGYQLAHELAVCGMLLGDDPRARWLVAATYDRMLGSIGHDQRFGTQYRGTDDGKYALGDVDTRWICDAERQALNCPTLEAARNRDLSATLKPSDGVREFVDGAGNLRDPKWGLSGKLPNGCTLREVRRWGDQCTTLLFEAPSRPDAHPNLYYRVLHKPEPLAGEALDAWYREEARRKEVSRRTGSADYTNRPDSLTARELGGRPAFTWLADYTDEKGRRYCEYMVNIRDEHGNAFLFLNAPAEQIDEWQPIADAFMAGLTLARIQPPGPSL